MKDNKKFSYREFTNQYSVSKTLRFELIPTDATKKYIETNGILKEDEQRAEDYKVLKQMIDRLHRKYISENLSDIQLQNLSEYQNLYNKTEKSEEEKEKLTKLKESLRKQISEHLTTKPDYKKLFGKELFGSSGILLQVAQNDDEKEKIRRFDKFSTYFSGFHDNRRNMYTCKGNSTEIAYRIVDQNLSRYLDNIKVYSKILREEDIVEQIPAIQQALADILDEIDIKNFFDAEFYSEVITSEAIAVYNTVINGIAEKDKKIQGLNEVINNHNQHIEKDMKKLPLFKPLYQQILSDKITFSFIDSEFESDEEVIKAIRDFIKVIDDEIFSQVTGTDFSIFLKNIKNYDLNRIYVKESFINAVSANLYDDWSRVRDKLEEDGRIPSTKGKKKKVDKSSLDVLESVTSNEDVKFSEYFISPATRDGKNLWERFNENNITLKNLLNGYQCHSKHGMRGYTAAVDAIKAYLDSVLEIQNLTKFFDFNDGDSEETFYAELDYYANILTQVISLNNKIRNYVTKKPYSREKIKLNFASDQLLGGWDINKEMDCLSVLFQKDEKYYLGIMSTQDKKIFQEVPEVANGNIYKKMIYKQIPNAAKYISSKQIIPQNPPESIANILKKKKEDAKSLSKKEITELISYCQNDFLVNYPSILDKNGESYFDFKFKKPEEYNSFNEFCADVDKQAYAIRFIDIPASYIEKLVCEGKLYLFQIYNKDFSEYSKGLPNLHTIYWKMLFDTENLQKRVFKLNGGAEVFYRKKSIEDENIIKHEANIPIKRKNSIQNEKNAESVFPYQIIKDRRYTVDKFQLHVPVTINYTAEGKERLNDKVLDEIRKSDGIYVIGIDRGERNLLYVTVINELGELVYQETLNIIAGENGYKQDYHALLEKREKDMLSARRGWKEIGSIKELKEGYLSQAIHRIITLMEQYNGIIVLEDLNSGFKNSRKKVEKQIYQKFEKMLIEKLNLTIDKKKGIDELGGPFNALQLANKFESFKKMGFQNGILFYIPAWNTSKIDPTTGFVNALSLKYTNMESARNYLSKFDRISYNPQGVDGPYFEFEIDYAKLSDKDMGKNTKWVVCSYGDRLVNYQNSEKNNEWDTKTIHLTDEFMALFEKYKITVSEDMLDEICKMDSPDFYKDLFGLLKNVVQLRNSRTGSFEDYILSPVKNKDGYFFDSSKAKDNQPCDADANGAYNIARKGLMLVHYYRENKDNKWHTIKNNEWLTYAQENVCL